jgi:hypothetical protein
VPNAEVTTMHDTLHEASSSAPASAIYTATSPFDTQRVGAAAVYCSDGRYGEQMDQFLHEHLELPRYDRVAVPGGAACLARHTAAMFERSALERQLRFLIEAHALTRVVLIAHHDCGFYKHRVRLTGGRSIAQQQAIDLKKAADAIRLWCPGVEVEGYCANPANGRVTFDRWPVA